LWLDEEHERGISHERWSVNPIVGGPRATDLPVFAEFET
jgi:hypothetical protein